ncbi:MmpS family protein, partial [Micromonospora phytophila]|uniref:MmpS family transport accessory protein n=1 Tax=Micromonospora phytophila TaxID=709888 RepID=UPI00202DCAE5
WTPTDPSATPAAGPLPGPPAGTTPHFPPPSAPGAPGAAWPPPGHLPPGQPPPYGYTYGYGHPAPPPVRSANRSTLLGVIVAGATVVVLGLCACLGIAGFLYSADGPYSDDPYAGEPYDDPYTEEPGFPAAPSAEPTPTVRPALTPSAGPGRVTVVYEVTGRGPADLEYYDANGDFIQVERVKLPWRRSMRMHDAERVMVLAGNSDDEALISCRITVDGEAVAEDQSDWGVNCTG